MSGSLTPELESALATRASASEGVAALATGSLISIQYPIKLNHVAVLGRVGPWHRSFLLRPIYGGRFVFLLYPKEYIGEETVLKRYVIFTGFNSAPELIDIKIPKELQEFRVWQYRLVKVQSFDQWDSFFEDRDESESMGDGMLHSRGAHLLADEADTDNQLSHLLFDTRPAIEGELVFEEEFSGSRAKLAAWSCHQPFSSQNGRAIIHEQAEPVLNWYKQRIAAFSPHRVWALGDTAYSDGTGTLNFVKQIHEKPGWHNSNEMRKDLLALYRINYRYHWSFSDMQSVMRNYPHLAMWDDHEIRDGYGSDQRDFSEENKALKQIASQAAEEYLFQGSPTLRSEARRNFDVDNHQAYIDNPIAAFIFDGRNSRKYGEDLLIPSEVSQGIAAIASLMVTLYAPAVISYGSLALPSFNEIALKLTNFYRWQNPGEVISEQQMQDFERFCMHIQNKPEVKYLLLGNSVPFIYVLDFLEAFAAESEIFDSSFLELRDDVRDSWHSPANRRQLNRLIGIMRNLHRARPDIEFINLSGDIHISNAFTYQPEGFNKPLYQITSSALTNRPSASSAVTNALSTDGLIPSFTESEDFGHVNRLWHEGTHQNFLTIDADETAIRFKLHVFNEESDAELGDYDRELTISPNGGYTLEGPDQT